MHCRVLFSKAKLVDIQNVVFINKINKSLMHKFFQYSAETRKQRNGSIVVHANHRVLLVDRNNVS